MKQDPVCLFSSSNRGNITDRGLLTLPIHFFHRLPALVLVSSATPVLNTTPYIPGI